MTSLRHHCKRACTKLRISIIRLRLLSDGSLFYFRIDSMSLAMPLAILHSICFRILCIWSFFASFFALATQCFYPDGSPEIRTDYEPCVSTSGIVSMCCGTNRTAPAKKDICLPNGLCHYPCSNGGDCSGIPGTYWRESCTDPKWNSPYCLKGVCTDNDVRLGFLNDNLDNGRMADVKIGNWSIR